MKINELFYNYINREQKEPRIFGRYFASEIYSIIKGYLTPQNFFEPQKVNLDGCRMMITGSAFESMLNQIFSEMKVDYEYQVKKEYQLNEEIILVAKPDFVFPNFIVETKFPFTAIKNNEIPLRYQYQLESYYRVFDYKEVYLGVLSVPFDVKLIRYTPNKFRWGQIVRALEKFHLELKKVVKNR